MELLVKVQDRKPDCLRHGVSVAPLGPFVAIALVE